MSLCLLYRKFTWTPKSYVLFCLNMSSRLYIAALFRCCLDTGSSVASSKDIRLLLSRYCRRNEIMLDGIVILRWLVDDESNVWLKHFFVRQKNVRKSNNFSKWQMSLTAVVNLTVVSQWCVEIDVKSIRMICLYLTLKFNFDHTPTFCHFIFL